jgi:hypothetical protein
MSPRSAAIQQGAQSSQPALRPVVGMWNRQLARMARTLMEVDDTSATAWAIVHEIIQTRNFFDDATDGIAFVGVG